MYPLKQSTSITVPMFVHDANGDPVTGLTDGSFTKRISKNGAAFAALAATVSELENGWYGIALSASDVDTLGILSLSFLNAGAKQTNLQFRVEAKLVDDLEDIAAGDVWSELQTASAGAGTMGRALLLSRYTSKWGPAVHFDSAAGNTGTVVGIDGTLENPVSSVAAWRTLSNALGIRRMVQDLLSTFTLDQSYEDFDLIGGTVDVNGQDVPFTRFFGPQIVTGTYGINTFGAYHYGVQFFSVQNIVGEFYQCQFSGTVALAGGGVAYQFVDCRSLDDSSSPTFDLTADPFGFLYEVDFRNWDGRMTITNSLRTDNIITADGDCEVVLTASCSAGLFRARGSVEVDDASTGTFTFEDDRTSTQVDEQLSTTHGAGSWEASATDATRLEEVWTLLGANTAAPVSFDATAGFVQALAAGIDITLSVVGTTVTLTRQP